MTVYALMCGGDGRTDPRSRLVPSDWAVPCATLAIAKAAFAGRFEWPGQKAASDGGPWCLVWRTPENIGVTPADWRISFGPRGGVRCERVPPDNDPLTWPR